LGLSHPRKDLEQDTIATYNLLEAMRARGVKTIAFASTGSVYGEAGVFPTPEDAPFPAQTSLWGASKLACEGLIAAYAEGYNMRFFIFRFVSLLGGRYTHGHVSTSPSGCFGDPSRLHISRQRQKAEVFDEILTAIERADKRMNIFNSAIEEYCEVDDSVGWISARLGAAPEHSCSGGERGWVGDNPLIFLDMQKIISLGWQPKLTIREGVERTVH
jgi:UDP-glucose 4-epimerase